MLPKSRTGLLFSFFQFFGTTKVDEFHRPFIAHNGKFRPIVQWHSKIGHFLNFET
jgi:hypothetical protein